MTLGADKRVIYEKDGVFCAEPSPDAIKNIAETVSAEVKSDVKLAESYASTMASLGIRTEGIAILRDLGYRVCEAYSNHAFHDGGVYQIGIYENIIKNANLGVVSLIGIESLANIKNPSNETASSIPCSMVQIVRAVRDGAIKSNDPRLIKEEAAAACLSPVNKTGNADAANGAAKDGAARK